MLRKFTSRVAAGLSLMALSLMAYAETLPLGAAQTITKDAEGVLASSTTSYSVSIETMLFMTALTLLPTVLLMMTAFTRIVIVLSLLRQAIGTNGVPPNQVVVGLSLVLTFFVMGPTFERMYEEGYKPYAARKIGVEEAMSKGVQPLKEFMLKQTRQDDIAAFAKMANIPAIEKAEDTPLRVLMPAFVVSELKTAFLIGFMVFIPFLIIDLVVASSLMAMGMMMVPPAMVGLPIKLLIFVLADGWTLLLGSLADSFK